MDVKEKVMEEFIKQFIKKDCKDILVDDIAFNIGMSKRTIYENFHSKNEIIKQKRAVFLTACFFVSKTKIGNRSQFC